MRKLPKLIFDTSAINALANDPDKDAIIGGICAAYRVGITETALSEVVANSNVSRRKELLRILKRLVGSESGRGVMPFHWITQEHVKAYESNPANYNWRVVNVRFLAGEREIAQEEFMHELSAETLLSNQKSDTELIETLTSVRPELNPAFERGKPRPGLEEIVKMLVAPGGAYFKLAADLYERSAGRRPADAELMDFVERCPPFKSMMMALSFMQYDLSVREANAPRLGKAGRLDTLSAVYLPYCETFITNDHGQQKALIEVAKLTGMEIEIQSYDDFRKKFLIG